MDFDAIFSVRNLLFLAGLLHFCQVPAIIVAPRILGWKQDLAKLQPINARIMQMTGLAIVIVVLGTGAVVMIGAAELARATPLAISLCALLGLFWLYRAVVQVAVYRRIWMTDALGRLSHYGLSILFFFLAGAYLFACVAGLRGHYG